MFFSMFFDFFVFFQFSLDATAEKVNLSFTGMYWCFWFLGNISIFLVFSFGNSKLCRCGKKFGSVSVTKLETPPNPRLVPAYSSPSEILN